MSRQLKKPLPPPTKEEIHQAVFTPVTNKDMGYVGSNTTEGEDNTPFSKQHSKWLLRKIEVLFLVAWGYIHQNHLRCGRYKNWDYDTIHPFILLIEFAGRYSLPTVASQLIARRILECSDEELELLVHGWISMLGPNYTVEPLCVVNNIVYDAVTQRLLQANTLESLACLAVQCRNDHPMLGIRKPEALVNPKAPDTILRKNDRLLKILNHSKNYDGVMNWRKHFFSRSDFVKKLQRLLPNASDEDVKRTFKIFDRAGDALIFLIMPECLKRPKLATQRMRTYFRVHYGWASDVFQPGFTRREPQLSSPDAGERFN